MNKDTKIERKPIGDLIPYEHNAKEHTKKQIKNLKTSFEKYGWQNPILIDEHNVIICGHGRILGATEAGMTEAPCIVCRDLTEKEIKDYRHLDNLLSEGDYLQDEFNIDLPDLSDFDFGEIDINIDLDGTEDDESAEVVEDEVSEEAEARCKLGDLWQLGRHRLICGDSTDPDVVAKLMGGGTADIAFTSPPYNVGQSAGLNGNTHMKKCKYQNGNDDLSDYDELLDKSTQNMITNAKWSFINLQMLSNNKKIICEWLNNYKDCLCDIAIWHKTHTAPAMAARVMNSQFEFVFVFSEENNSRAIGTNNFRGTVSNVYVGRPQMKNEFSTVHSATFPNEFANHFVSQFTNKDDAVLDVFGGTGTTLIVCEQIRRKCYMCELEPRYCDVIIQRWENLTGQTAKKIN